MKWIVAEAEPGSVAALSVALGVSLPAARVLCARGLGDPADAREVRGAEFPAAVPHRKRPGEAGGQEVFCGRARQRSSTVCVDTPIKERARTETPTSIRTS